jgi:nitroreductase
VRRSVDVVQGLLETRFSCRAFLDRPVDRATITRILELAQHSPSWCNTQPWQVFVTASKGTERLRTAIVEFAAKTAPQPDLPFPARYEGVYQERRRECGWQLCESLGIARGDRAASAAQALENCALFGAPHVAVVTTERDLGVYGAVDCGVYLGCFLIATQSLDVAAIPQAALAAVAPVIREQFNLPDNRQVLFGVSLGYADDEQAANRFRTTRADLRDVVTWVT